jgi:hypothetical protein
MAAVSVPSLEIVLEVDTVRAERLDVLVNRMQSVSTIYRQLKFF